MKTDYPMLHPKIGQRKHKTTEHFTWLDKWISEANIVMAEVGVCMVLYWIITSF